jgi:hypothetical protein
MHLNAEKVEKSVLNTSTPEKTLTSLMKGQKLKCRFLIYVYNKRKGKNAPLPYKPSHEGI